MEQPSQKLSTALWRIYNRPQRPTPWVFGGNLPWNDPAFSARMLREHLDESHSAATRQTAEREALLAWLWQKLALRPGADVLDVTCGPGLYAVPLAERGCHVTGIDFGPAAIAHAQELAASIGVMEHCHFIEDDVRNVTLEANAFDAAMFLYGQLTVFTRAETEMLLARIAGALRPGGRLCVELLHPHKIDKKDSRWWYTDDTGLWGDSPFLHLGERFWYAEERLSLERFLILHLETGELDEVQLCDQMYEIDEMVALMRRAGFSAVDVYPQWGNLPLYDMEEWVVYVATR